jgi:hypothetical protein
VARSLGTELVFSITNTVQDAVQRLKVIARAVNLSVQYAEHKFVIVYMQVFDGVPKVTVQPVEQWFDLRYD